MVRKEIERVIALYDEGALTKIAEQAATDENASKVGIDRILDSYEDLSKALQKQEQ